MYKYENIRPNLFTDSGQRMFLSIRDRAHELLKESGSFRLDAVMMGTSGSSWDMIACVDRMVELGEIREINQPGVAGQHRIFVKV